MELNREQIIKALECCGAYTHGTTCNNCPYMYIELAENEICSNRMSLDALSLIKELTEEKKSLEYTLAGVMHSVDKWLDGKELKQDEVNRAITMREKTLRIVEKLTEENESLERENDDLTREKIVYIQEKVTLKDEIERVKAQRYYVYPDGKIEMIPTVESAKADTVRKMQERLVKRFKGDKYNVYTVYNIHRYIDQIAKEMLEGGETTNEN